MQMMRIQLCAMKSERKKILEDLQRLNFVEIKPTALVAQDEAAAKALPEGAEKSAVQNVQIFKQQNTKTARALLEKNTAVAEAAVKILDNYVPYKGQSLAFLRGRQALTPQEMEEFAKKRDKTLSAAGRIADLERGIAESKAEILRYNAQMEALVPWLGLPISQMSTGTKKTAIFIGQFDGRLTEEDILAKLAQQQPKLDKVHIEMVYQSDEITCVCVIVLKRDAVEAEQSLRAIGFTRPASPTHRIPEDKQKNLEERLAKAEADIAKRIKDIEAFADKRDDFLLLRDECVMREEKYAVIEKLALSKHTFVLDGYIASPYARGSKTFENNGAAWGKTIEEDFEERFGCAVEVWTPTEQESGEELDVPVKLKNTWFSEPVESVLSDYSLPGKKELDPTGIMSVFYYIMFGLMFSDAGYGLIMVVVCGIALLKFKNMENNWNRYLRMYFWCGVCTMFWGIMFGSFFGDLITVFSGKFFGNAIPIKPLWLSPTQQPMLLLIYCLGIGVIHMTVGVVLKAVNLIKNKQYAAVIFDAVFDLMVLYGLLLNFVCMDMFEDMAGFKASFPPVVGSVCWIMVLVGIVGILLFGGRESKNIFKRMLKGAYAVYNMLAGWLGDILSYSRLLALGLATGIIAEVMNTLGAMVGSGVVGVLFFVIVFVVGQALNFGINVLGAYVHSNRLEYVEFFGKFYEGGGRAFEPFGIHTKHYKII